jgi:hypothetical protein
LRRAPADVLPGCRRRDVMVLLGDVAKTCQLNGVYIYIIYIYCHIIMLVILYILYYIQCYSIYYTYITYIDCMSI